MKIFEVKFDLRRKTKLCDGTDLHCGDQVFPEQPPAPADCHAPDLCRIQSMHVNEHDTTKSGVLCLHSRRALSGRILDTSLIAS